MRTSRWIRTGLLCLLGMMTHALAANTPCSGRKGGVDYCREGQFVCRDGSVSASRKVCSAPSPSTPQQRLTAPATHTDCSCRSGAVCVGPRGGHYCLSDSGRKSYLRR